MSFVCNQFLSIHQKLLYRSSEQILDILFYRFVHRIFGKIISVSVKQLDNCVPFISGGLCLSNDISAVVTRSAVQPPDANNVTGLLTVLPFIASSTLLTSAGMTDLCQDSRICLYCIEKLRTTTWWICHSHGQFHQFFFCI